MQPRLATTDAEIQACFPVVVQLRPHLRPGDFVQRVRAQQAEGYRLAYLSLHGEPVAVAGYRFGQNLAWGKFLYVDDLVTSAGHRSRGYGWLLLRWLLQEAKAHGCQQVHLDSGVQRQDAHRFYRREGMELSSYHFRLHVS